MADTTTISTQGFFGTVIDRIHSIATQGYFTSELDLSSLASQDKKKLQPIESKTFLSIGYGKGVLSPTEK